MREKTFSLILKVHLLLPDRLSEGEVTLRGSVQQVGPFSARYFGSWAGLLAILQETMAAAGSDEAMMTQPDQTQDP